MSCTRLILVLSHQCAAASLRILPIHPWLNGAGINCECRVLPLEYVPRALVNRDTEYWWSTGQATPRSKVWWQVNLDSPTALRLEKERADDQFDAAGRGRVAVLRPEHGPGQRGEDARERGGELGEQTAGAAATGGGVDDSGPRHRPRRLPARCAA